MILDIKSTDFENLKNDILKYIKSLDVYQDIINEMPKSTIELLTSLIAGYAAYTNFKFSMNRNETFLQTATLSSSIFQIAFALGYRAQRAKAPILTFRYFGNDDIILNPGDIIGQYKINDNEILDIIFFDYPKKIKNNDYVNFVIGKYNEIEVDAISEFNIKYLSPSILRSIDNNNIFIEDKDGLFKPSILFEDFILNNKIINWSTSNADAAIYINDKENNFGKIDIINLSIKYIETNGFIDNININNLKITKSFAFENIYFNGLNEDSLDKIKRMAPNLRNTKARAVTLNDYYYYILNTNIFEDVYVEPEQNIPANWRLDFTTFDDFDKKDTEYALNIEGSYISLVRYSYESLDDFKVRFYNLLIHNELVTPKLIRSADNTYYELYIEQKFLEREIEVSGKNIEPVKLNDFVRAQSCILNVYYVKKGTEPLRKPLTTSELMYLDNYIKNYAIVGIKLVYIPAIPKVANISLSVKLIDNRFQDEVYQFIKDTINKYQYKVNTSFEINNIISEITKYKTTLNGVEIYPVQYVRNLNSEDVINTEKYEYLVFYGIDISFE